ncbi:hypothetical protein MRB53_001859 [Persea americana]|uniref:Uncharacterized protein n=1 Tax=Persea americana TaxID=3435 RepID=A0ACC2MSX8_PERAE|nr:hypothetical protein MRB53_001859 [Persea americana]
MESGVCCGRIPAVEALPAVVKSEGGSRIFSAVIGIGALRSHNFARISFASQGLVNFCGSQRFGGKNHPHIFNVAAAEQLEELVAERNGAFARREQSLGSTELCLHGLSECANNGRLEIWNWRPSTALMFWNWSGSISPLFLAGEENPRLQIIG